jgi:hypothetical protein
VRTIIGALGAFLAGLAGWKIGSQAGPGTAWVLSCIGGGAGLYFGRRWFDDNLG